MPARWMHPVPTQPNAQSHTPAASLHVPARAISWARRLLVRSLGGGGMNGRIPQAERRWRRQVAVAPFSPQDPWEQPSSCARAVIFESSRTRARSCSSGLMRSAMRACSAAAPAAASGALPSAKLLALRGVGEKEQCRRLALRVARTRCGIHRPALHAHRSKGPCFFLESLELTFQQLRLLGGSAPRTVGRTRVPACIVA